MDFRRIEIIFLCVFIALDIFLFTSYRQTRNQVVNTNNVGSTTLEKEMNQDNITINSKLDKRVGEGYYLASQDDQHVLRNDQVKLRNITWSYDEIKKQLNCYLNNPLVLTPQTIVPTLKRYIKKTQNVTKGQEYEYCRHLSSDNNVVFVQKVKLGRLYENTGRVTFKIINNRLVSYEQTYVNAMNVLREKQNTISEQRAVYNLYTNNEIPNNSQLKWADLAYAKLMKFKNNTIYIPVWYVAFVPKGMRSTQIRQVNAFSGAVIKVDQTKGGYVNDRSHAD
ncbi:two-component system regulatory protein YycI [Bombilactobacillus folatiphilus]|uniref:Two-component system regulatory protein YycI n=1 Tax=Bombilactobacillus folatiphilus TaxID=2923362 RepID=A0ABY4P988_9LACO|nr:two-component system regulatory protein YycI [Bombilactobacillus folatiphilus]UQS82101.1 two-component system regulatory protein YycI [Bombilactobacillus folatiphilus]